MRIGDVLVGGADVDRAENWKMTGLDLAQIVVAHFGTRDVTEIARRANASIRIERWAPVTAGECHHTRRTIVVNAAARPPVSLIVAHELGHLLAGDLGVALDEREAHLFAEAITCPLFAACGEHVSVRP